MNALPIDGLFVADARKGTRKLWRALATYHSRNAPCPATRSHWTRLITPQKPQPRAKKLAGPFAMRKSTAMVELACELAGVTKEELFSAKRSIRLTMPRYALCGTMKKCLPGLSLGQIARALGRDDHTFTIYSISRYHELFADDEAFRAMCLELERLA